MNEIDQNGKMSFKQNLHDITLAIVNKFTENGTDSITYLADEYYEYYIEVYEHLKEKFDNEPRKNINFRFRGTD